MHTYKYTVLLIIGPTPSAEETVALLVNDGLFDLALDICRVFRLPLITLFEGLASRSEDD